MTIIETKLKNENKRLRAENIELKDLICEIDQWAYEQSSLQKMEGSRVKHDAACELWAFEKKKKNRRCTCGLTHLLREVAKVAKEHKGNK